LDLRGDTVELKTGERVEGTFRQAGASGVVIEVAGQAITLPSEKVQAIYFGAAKPLAASPAAPPASQEALDAIKALRSITGSGIAFRDYAPRVLDARIKVDNYLSASASDAGDLRGAIGLAMREYELASRVWGASISGDSSIPKTIEASLDPDLLNQCPVVKKVLDWAKLATDFRILGFELSSKQMVDGQPGYVALWQCAAGEVAEAQRLSSPSNQAPPAGTGKSHIAGLD
jgi:hypothetical protein